MSRRLHAGISEQRQSSRHRMDDARALLAQDRWSGAMYMAGYAIECLLKVKLMERYRCVDLAGLQVELERRKEVPRRLNIFTHELSLLLGLTGARPRLLRDAKYSQLFQQVNHWIPAWRYNVRSSQAEAREFVRAVETLHRWIENNV